MRLRWPPGSGLRGSRLPGVSPNSVAAAPGKPPFSAGLSVCDRSIHYSTSPAEPQHLPGHLKGAPKVFMGDLCDVQPDLMATSISTGPAGHCPGPCHPNYRKRRRLRQPRRVTGLQGKPMAAQGLPRGPTGQSPPSPTDLGKAAALRRQQENETHSEWPLSHHLCSCSPPPTLSCTGRRTCMQIPPRAQRREGPADQGAGRRAEGSGAQTPPRKDKQDHGRRGFKEGLTTLSWGAPWLRDRTSGLWACMNLGTAVIA